MTNAILPNLTEIPEARSNYISRIGWDVDFLFVEFRRDKSLFRFDDVSQKEFDALMAASSMGQHFKTHITGRKQYHRMDKKAVMHMPTADAVDDGSLAHMVRESVMKVKAFVVVDVESHSIAQEWLHKLARLRERVVNHHAETKRKTYEAWQSICKAEKSLLDPLKEADDALRKNVGDYTHAAMKRAAEEDKKRRLEAEAHAIEHATRESEEVALRAAMELEAMGDKEGAEAVLAHPMPVAPIFAMPTPTRPEVAKVEGISGAMVWRATITDIQQVPREFLVVDMAKTVTELERRAKQVQGRLQVAGVSFQETWQPRRVGGRQ